MGTDETCGIGHTAPGMLHVITTDEVFQLWKLLQCVCVCVLFKHVKRSKGYKGYILWQDTVVEFICLILAL